MCAADGRSGSRDRDRGLLQLGEVEEVFEEVSRPRGPGTYLHPDRAGTAHPQLRRPQSAIAGAAEPRLKSFAQNHLRCQIVSLACEPLAWIQMFALNGTRPATGNRNGSGRAWSAAASGSGSAPPGDGSAEVGVDI